ncbi:MAG: formate/nitrite transporter family protein, partial [Burkholderiales bacterium]|nr:formate/nitrite transporter family protein [Burkholderiales bacterium]
VLVCLAVWMAMAGRSLVDKAVAIVFPISAFVAAGFEHSIANMFFIPAAMLAGFDVTWSHFFVANLVPVTLGNLVGGAIFVGLPYVWLYTKPQKALPTAKKI